MEPEQQEVTAPIERDFEEAFESDFSDMDIPGFEDVSQPAAKQAADTEEAEQTAAETDEQEEQLDDKAKAIAAAKAATKGPEPVATLKKVAFKVGEQAVELLEDAVVDWKVDGKQTPVPLKDLLQNYSGKVAWEKRFNEVAEQRKQFAELSRSFESERSRHVAAINEMHKAATEGRTFDAVTAMLKLSGAKQSPREYIATLRSGLVKQAEEMAKLSPEQRQLMEKEEELAYLKAEGQQAQQQREQEHAQRAFQERVVKAMNAVGSTVDEFVKTRDWLLAEGPRIEGNKWDPNAVTPEYVAQQIVDVRDYRTAKEALDAVDPELSKDEALWKQAVGFLRDNKDWTVEDLKEVYREATKQKRSQAISKKVAKAPVATTATASSRMKSAKSMREDYSSFDEFDKSW